MPASVARRRQLSAIALTVGGAIGVLACLALAIVQLSSLTPDASAEPSLVLGIPWPAAGITAFTVALGVGVALLATDDGPRRRHIAAGVFTLVAASVGLWAAWALTADKVVTVTRPTAELECNFSLLVQCGANLESWQGSLLGFPNPLLGLGGWAAAAVAGTALLVGVPLARWFWVAFTSGVSLAMALVAWLIGQSIFVLGTLCPWCMVTWAVTIPLFWLSWGMLLSASRNERVARAAAATTAWVPLLTFASYLVVALLAQLRLEVLSYL